jgi:hypothetical protein
LGKTVAMSSDHVQRPKTKFGWFRYGMTGIALLVAVALLDFSVCGHSSTCPLNAITSGIDRNYDAFIQHIGRRLGARYGYVPYFPNRATRVFLNTLAMALPWFCFFLMGVFTYLAVSIVRAKGRSHNKYVEKS